jgi:hypothetical protein
MTMIQACMTSENLAETNQWILINLDCSSPLIPGKSKRPTVVIEKALKPDKARWWKTVNGVQRPGGTATQILSAYHRPYVPSFVVG